MQENTFIVLGMHKSGTTLVSQILHSSGINMGFDIDDQGFQYSGNKCESPTVTAINNDILGTRGLLSVDISSSLDLRENEDIRTRILTFVEKAFRFSRWGIKDPRMCLTYHVWKKYLPQHALICVYRHPLQVWKHYLTPPYYGIFYCLKVFKRYIEYNTAIIQIMNRHSGPVLLLNYNDLMHEEEEFRRLQDFVGYKLKDMRDPKMYKQRSAFKGRIYHFHERVVRAFTGMSFHAVYSKLNVIHEKQTRTHR